MSSASTYALLNRAQVSYEYLHTNSTTHDFLFGAMVELVDNSRDAEAHNMHIFYQEVKDNRAHKMLCFLDDGHGMDQEDAHSVMTLGFSAKKFNPAQIGQYGNGLKSGAMRIGHDFILFTKRDDMMTCVFLSRTFHDKENIHEVVVPMPTFTVDGMAKIEGDDEKRKHEIEMNIIYKYSPFKTQAELFKQFRKIEGKSGTMVCLFNLRLLDSGEPELNFGPEDDILINDPDNRDYNLVPERKSLRAYLAVVYKDPFMKIYINHKKVRTRRMISSLYKPRTYDHMSRNFKERADKDIVMAQHSVETAKRQLADAKDRLGQFNAGPKKEAHTMAVRIELRQLNYLVSRKESELKQATEMLKEKQKSRNDPKPLQFTFGLNLSRRTHCGAMIYNNGRLIKMYQKVGPQMDYAAHGSRCLGVIAVVDVPYIVLEPTHNKQDFANAREYRLLLNDLGKYMEQYWEDIKLRDFTGGLPKFWEHYGYLSTNSNEPPSDEPQYLTKRVLSVPPCIQCDKCFKWRIVQPKRQNVTQDPALDWVCSDNPDAEFNSCDKPQRLPVPPVGKLQKIPETSAQMEARTARLKKEMERKAKELERIEREQEVAKQKQPLPKNANFQKKSQQQAAPTRGRGRGRQESSSEEEEEEESEDEEEKPVRRSTGRPPTKAASPAKPKTKAQLRAQQAEDAARQKKAEEKRKKEDEKRRREKAEAARRKAVQQAKGEESEEEEMEVSDVIRARKASSRVTASPASTSKRVSSSPAASTSRAATAAAAAPPPAKQAKTKPDPVVANGDAKAETPSTSFAKPGPASSKQKAAAPADSTTSDPAPSTSSAESKAAQHADLVRRLLRQFCPPKTSKYSYDKSDFEKMSNDDLLNVNLDDFTNAWHAGISDLIEQKKKEYGAEVTEQMNEMMVKCCELLAPMYDGGIEDACRTDPVKCIAMLDQAIPVIKGSLSNADAAAE